MSSRRLTAVAVLVAAIAAGPGAAAAQEVQQYDVPRTAWGHPDLQGIWINDTSTSFERPEMFAGREFLTDEEVRQMEQRMKDGMARANEPSAQADEREAPKAGGSVGGYNRFWFGDPALVVRTRRTSLVIDPPDGRVPLRESAAEKRLYDLEHRQDHWRHMSVYTRCITRGIPGTMFPALYNNGHQILQTRDHVIVLHEMVRHARMIPLDGSPHPSPKIGMWMGDSRGRWEGDTLVVETTNFNDRGWVASNAAARRMQGIPVSDKLRVIERFTRVADDLIDYEVTVEDDEHYTAPWTASIPMFQDPGYEIYEYACHEGNQATGNILRGGRVLDQDDPESHP